MSYSSAYSSPQPPPPQFRPFDVKPMDMTKIYIHPLSFQDPISSIRSVTRNGVPPEPDSMLSLFNACLQVGSLDRAAAVLARFCDFDILPPADMVHLHNRYLRANIECFSAQPDAAWADLMRAWYETRIRAPGLPQTPETIACMLKISILGKPEPQQLTRFVNRYMSMVAGEAAYEVLSYRDLLSDQDVNKICSECSFYELSPDDFIPSDEPQVEGGKEDPEVEQSSTTSGVEVRPVQQKGLGLQSLKDVLSIFGPFGKEDVGKLPLEKRREIQSSLERNCVTAAINRWKEENEALMKLGRNPALSSAALNSQLYEWHIGLEAWLKKDLALYDERENVNNERRSTEENDRCIYGPFLKLSTPSRLAAVTIMGLLNCLGQSGIDNGALVSTAVTTLARFVEEDISVLQADQNKKTQRRVLRSNDSKKAESILSSDTLVPDVEVQEEPLLDVKAESRYWPMLVKTKVGSFLLQGLVETAKITVNQEHPQTKEPVSQSLPAFSHNLIFKRGRRMGIVVPNKFLTELMKREPRADFLARHLPMVVPPRPWTKFDKGGFLDYPSSLIRMKHGTKDQEIYASAAIKRGDLDQVMRGLDILGQTAWKINGPVLDAMIEAWNTGEPVANIPPLNPDLPVPPEPEDSSDPLERRRWLRALKEVENEKSGLHSQRCFMNFQLEIANAFRKQTIYFPHNMDFRGRAYPLPTYLNHMGADHARGLLLFAEGRELGEPGLRWLKVHLANVFGYDKASLAEREEFTMKNMDNVLDSATSPFRGKKWWLQAEDQWQCLAACFELKAAMDSLEPTKYISHLPVHQDGTCNGLQHYAALGGDLWGAQQVNLEPGERPADVYSAVAELVKQSIADDVKADNFLGKAVEDKISRKVVKQTVMTNVYGVTFMGARQQVLKQLLAAYPNIQEETGVGPLLLASYIATKIFNAMSTMFRGAHDIQYWLGECASRICRAILPEQIERLAKQANTCYKVGRKKKQSAAEGALAKAIAANTATQAKEELEDQYRSTLVWTTPLRLPVVQPYRKESTRIIRTHLQDLILAVPDRGDPVNRRKQLQAFPPNFIHSLDATHMLLSALECNDKGLSFAAVHDSFWTHAADVDVMNNVLRDAFIRVHSEDVIKRLAIEFETRYKHSLYQANLALPPDLEAEIAAHRKTVKFTKVAELVQESQRLALLRSDDPAMVERGRQMRTPGSIYEKYFGSANVPIDFDEVQKEVGLAKIPSAQEMIAAAEEDEEADGMEQKEEADKPVKRRQLKAGDDAVLVKSLMAVGGFEAAMTKHERAKPASSTKYIKKTMLWLPLIFPPIPKKGEFNVERLKTSQYFFS